MKPFSFRVRAFIYLVCLVGITACLFTFVFHPITPAPAFVTKVILGSLVAFAAGSRKVKLMRTSANTEGVFITLGFLITFIAIMTLGTRAGIVVGAASAVGGAWLPKRQRVRQMLFNVAVVILSAGATSLTYKRVNNFQLINKFQLDTSHLVPYFHYFSPTFVLPSRIPFDIHPLPATFAAALVYFLLNSSLIACVVSLQEDKPLLQIWQQRFLWSLPGFLGGAYCALLAITLIDAQLRLLVLMLPIIGFMFNSYRTNAGSIAQKLEHIEQLETGRLALHELYFSTVRSLATAIDAKDQYTHAHIQRVQHYTLAIAAELKVDGPDLEALRAGALLHDVGKLGVPDNVLLKPGQLTPEEFEKMKAHPVIGAAILEPVRFPYPVAAIVRHHHERWDGKGYPDGLAGEDIPLGARILSVADVYDALTSDRPYRPAWTRGRTLAFLKAEAGRQFDPQVVDVFLALGSHVFAEDDAKIEGAALIYGASILPVALLERRHTGSTTSELWVLNEVERTLAAARPLRDRLDTLSTKLAEAVPGTTCAFMLLDVDRNPLLRLTNGTTADLSLPRRGLRVLAAAGTNADILFANPIMEMDSPSACVANTCQTYRGIYNDIGFSWSIPGESERPVRSVLIVPLLSEDEASGDSTVTESAGTLSLYHADVDAFSREDERLMTIIAGKVYAAIESDLELAGGSVLAASAVPITAPLIQGTTLA